MHRSGNGAALILWAVVLATLASTAVAGDELAMRFVDEVVEGEYNVVCPVVIGGEGELRVGFDATGEGDLSWVRVGGRKAALFRSAGGVERRVGQGARVAATGATDLTVQRRNDRVRVVVGNQLVLDVPWDGAPGGGVGAASTGSHVASKPVTQPVDAPMVTDDFTRDGSDMGLWETAGGSFENTMVSATGAEARLSANPFSLRVRAEEGAVASTGYWFWDTYRVALSVRPVNAPSVSLRAWVRDEANYVALRWQAGDPGQPRARRLVLVRDGVEQVLAAAPGGYAPGEWYRLELRVTPGRVEGLIDRERVFEAKTTALAQGAVGFSLPSGEAFFDDLLIAPPDYREGWPPKINPVFLADEVMTAEEVFIPRGFWRSGEAPGEYRHWGEFFDDALVTIPLELLSGDGLSVLLRSGGGDGAAGYRVDAVQAGEELAITLWRNGVEIASEAAPLQGEEPLVVSVQGRVVEASQAERTLLRHDDPRPLSGRRVALLGAPPSAVDLVTVWSERFRDYVFDTSPTDWFAGKGQWAVTTRWPCEPGWTFYGGTGDENPLVWTKHTYRGDMVLEWFGAIQSDNVNRIRYMRPSDVNATICGDGMSLSRGYSFILGGWNNTKTAILRNGEVVAQTSEVILPDPNARDLSAHRGWSRVRVEKFGNRIRMYYEKELVLEYTDPDPLPEGRVGLWSFHNEPVAGRVRLWFAEEGPPSVVRRPEPRLTQLTPLERPEDAGEILNDFEAGSGEWRPLESPGGGALLELDTGSAASGRASLRITNQEDGGPFAVAAVTTPFRVREWPELSFDYRLTPETKVNIYLLVNERWHAVTLSGEQMPWDDVPVIGEVTDVMADGRWHHAQVNLLQGLQELDPALSSAEVTQVVFSAPWESYVQCGIGGNVLGARYWIDNFRVGPEQ